MQISANEMWGSDAVRIYIAETKKKLITIKIKIRLVIWKASSLATYRKGYH